MLQMIFIWLKPPIYQPPINHLSITHQLKIMLPTRLKLAVDFVGWVSGFIA